MHACMCLEKVLLLQEPKNVQCHMNRMENREGEEEEENKTKHTFMLWPFLPRLEGILVSCAASRSYL